MVKLGVVVVSEAQPLDELGGVGLRWDASEDDFARRASVNLAEHRCW